MADSKVTTYAAAFLIVGILIGTAVGFALFHTDNAEKNETYWFYIDYGTNVDDTHKNGWYSAKATNNTDAFKSAMKTGKVDFELGENGFINHIMGLSWVQSTKTGWGIWAWDSKEYVNSEYSQDWFRPGVAMGNSVGNAFYLGYFQHDDTYMPVSSPYNNVTAWSTSGPFTASG